jgi:hypothetical protein
MSIPHWNEGQYDLRAGVSAYAPIVGAFGALAVPTVVLVFTLPSQHIATESNITFSTGLLVIGMLGSLLGSFGLAAIGAERDPTANLAPAAMYIAVPVALSIASVLGAFEVLAAIYIPSSANLFLWILVCGGVFGVLFTALTLAENGGLGPTDPGQRARWLTTEWLKNRRQGYRWAQVVAAGTSLPVLVAVGSRMLGLNVRPTYAAINSIVGAGISLVMIGTLLGIVRLAHPLDGHQRGIRPVEAIGTTASIGLFVAALVLLLP